MNEWFNIKESSICLATIECLYVACTFSKQTESTTCAYDQLIMAEDLVQDYLNDDDFKTLLTAHGDLPSTAVVKISVDGEDGDIVARHFSGQANDGLALVRVSSKSE